MAPIKFALSCPLFLLLPICFAFGQGGPLAGDYVRIAEDFKTNSQRDSAIIYYEKASGEYQKQGDLEGYVRSCNQIGILLTRQDKYAPAKSYLDKALTTGLSIFDSTHLEVAVTYLALGVVFAAEEHYSQSLGYHHKALSIRLQKLGRYHADVATSYGNIGNVYYNSKDYDRAIEAHLEAKKIRAKLYGKSGAEITPSYTFLGRAYREKSKYKSSLKYFKKALTNKTEQLGVGHKDLARFQKEIDEVILLMENKKKAAFPK
jgi:tetratricopeptide (TPR) repeat protein